MGVVNPDGTPIPQNEMMAGLVADVKLVESQRADVAAHNAAVIAAHNINSVNGTGNGAPVSEPELMSPPQIVAYLTYPNFYRIKKWNNSNWYAIAIAELADRLK